MPRLEEMTIGIGQLICPHDKPLHLRFDAQKGKRYSLNELFQKNHSKSSPLKINVAIGWYTYTDLDLLIFPMTNDGRLLDPIGSKYQKRDANRSIQSQGDSKKGVKYGDNEIITIDLNRVDSNTKCILIALSSY